MKSSILQVRLIALCLAGPGLAGVSAVPVQYTFSSIEVPAELGAFASAYGINNAGVLVGNFVTVDGSLRARGLCVAKASGWAGTSLEKFRSVFSP